MPSVVAPLSPFNVVFTTVQIHHHYLVINDEYQLGGVVRVQVTNSCHGITSTVHG